MALDFYLSEMAVSSLHGGGITLQRILGSDLGGISRFIYPSRFAKDLPPIASLQPRSEYTLHRLERNAARKWLGHRPCRWLIKKGVLRRAHIRQCSSNINAAFPNHGALKGLVCPQSETSVLVLEALKSRRKVRYITWMMDDHVVRLRNGDWTYPRGFKKIFEKHLCEAEKVFVISPRLGSFYKREFGVDSQVLFGPADIVDEPARLAPRAGGGCRLGYFGSLGSWQLDALLKLAKHLHLLDATLDIFTPASALPLELQIPRVNLRHSISSSMVIQEMRKYDAVVLPISFSESNRHLTDFNIATKMSECLASGTVTLVVAPEYAAMVDFLIPHHAACFSRADSVEELRVTFENLKDESYRRTLLGSARGLVNSELSTSVMQGRWKEAVFKLLSR